MADADEDIIQTSSKFLHEGPPVDHLNDDEPDDEVPDFQLLKGLERKLNTSNSNTDTSLDDIALLQPHTLPRRGEKDFEPHGLRTQDAQLDKSRRAMREALSFERWHNPGRATVKDPAPGMLIGWFEPSWGKKATPSPQLLEQPETGDTFGAQKRNARSGFEDECNVVIEHPKGASLRHVGTSDRYARVWLNAEEALFLVERGELSLRYRGQLQLDANGDCSYSGQSERRSSGSDHIFGFEQTPDIKAESLDFSSQNEIEDRLSIDKRNQTADCSNLEGIPLSLQASYAFFIGTQDLSLERYQIYAGLRRLGYVVQRAPTWSAARDDLVDPEIAPLKGVKNAQQTCLPVRSPLAPSSAFLYHIYNAFHKYLQRTLSAFCLQPRLPSNGPLIQPGLYHSYASIYSRLAIIPFHNPAIITPSTSNTSEIPVSSNLSPLQSPIRPHFHVWKPTSAFRKKSPPPPDFLICVIDARHESFPTLAQLDDLLQSSCPFVPPPQATSKHSHGNDKSKSGPRIGTTISNLSPGALYGTLRHGYRKIILAVVDAGIVSYVQITESGFATVPIWDRGGGRGGKAGRGGEEEGVVVAEGRGRGR